MKTQTEYTGDTAFHCDPFLPGKTPMFFMDTSHKTKDPQP